MARDLIEPGPEIAFRLVGVTVLQNPEKHLLGQILTEGPVRGQILEVAQDARIVPVEEQFQLADGAFPDFPHRLFVFHLAP